MKLPELAEPITSYALFDRLIEEDFKRHRRDLLVVAEKGLGKSFRLDKALKNTPHLYVCGHTSATKHYARALEAENKYIVYDDYNSAVSNDEIGEILKQQTENIPVRTVRWDGSATAVPRPSFNTTSPVLIVVNSWRSGPTWDALADRLGVYHFAPSKEEWVWQVAEWLTNQGVAGRMVLDYLKQRLPDLARLTCRQIGRALKVAQEGGALPWRAYIDRLCDGGNQDEVLMRELVESPDYAHAKDGTIVEAWRGQTGKGRSWAFEVLGKVRRRMEENARAVARVRAVADAVPPAATGLPDGNGAAPANVSPLPHPTGQTDPVGVDRPVVRPPEGSPPSGDDGDDWAARWLEGLGG